MKEGLKFYFLILENLTSGFEVDFSKIILEILQNTSE